MANAEHLKILEQGVEVWNAWRRENRSVPPDLSQVSLIEANLNRADLNRVNLSFVNLSFADLSWAYLVRADLSGANLMKADLFKADIGDGSLSEANLSEANLSGAVLSGADINSANLSKANFSGAKLGEANLVGANLYGVDFFEADLWNCNLSNTDLRNSDLRHANLVRADLSGSNITGASLYGTSRDDWVIDGITCQYVYLGDDFKKRTPRDRNFEPGEFERLYRVMPTVLVHFLDGMSPSDLTVLAETVSTVATEQPEWELCIASVEGRGLYPEVKCEIRKEAHRPEAQRAIIAELENRMSSMRLENAKLTGERDAYMQIATGAQNPVPAPVQHIHNYNIGNITALEDGNIQIGQGTKADNYVQISIEKLNIIREQAQTIVDEVPDESLPQQAKEAIKETLADTLKDLAKDATREGLKKAAEAFKDKATEWATSPAARAAIVKIGSLIIGAET